ncbi:MAG TPA: hypothetical protein VFQ35_07700 [Polyangiaceae bacterium]|nr:hypothetical protein [Polyangiaceae bacterium]
MSHPIQPSLAIQNPAAYRARIKTFDHTELRRYLESLTREQLRNHMRVMEPVKDRARGGFIGVYFRHGGGPWDPSIPFGVGDGFASSGKFPLTSRYAEYMSLKRELAREVRVRLKFTIRFESEPFTLTRLENFMEVCQKFVASEVTLRRFVLAYFPESHERGLTDPASVTLFAHLETEHGEDVHVELCTTAHPGYEERLVGWVRERASEFRVPFEQQGTLRKRSNDTA